MIGRQLGRYEILARLGSGGMGEVYRARDRDLGREVAVKVLPADLASNPSRLARFEFEARTASALNHPNIVTIYEIGRAEGTAYIAMELVEGKTLRDLLGGRPLLGKQALGYAAQAADGLARAHAAGIVHRDLKPENIMITSDGRVKILDFGLAKVEAPLGDVDSQSPTGHATQPGALLGTVSYMSPEQARGRAVDYRSDQFSCGLILYEMATGRRAFQRASAVQTLSAIIEKEPEPIAALNPDCPPPFRWIIERCLAKSPDDRYASTLDLARELQTLRDNVEETLAGSSASGRIRLPRQMGQRWRWRLAAGLGVVVTAVLLWPRLERILPRGGAADATREPPVVAVLPLVNLGTAQDEFLGVGIADVLATALGRAPGVTLVAPSATRGYRGEIDVAVVGRELGANLIVEGTLQRLGGRVRVSVSLVEAASRRVVWSDGLDARPEDLLSLQWELADGVATALELRLSPEQRGLLARPPTTNPEALADYAQARSFLERPDVAGNVERAIALFEAALEKDRRFALAHAGLGEAYWERYRTSKDAAWTARAMESILEALRLDPDQPQVRVALASAFRGSGRTEEAVDELRRALLLQPNNDDAHRLLGNLLADLGRSDEAIGELRRAVALRPNYWRNHSFLGNAYFRLGRYDDAIASFERLTQLQPDNARGFQMLGTAHHAKGDSQQALENYEKAIAITPIGSAYSNIGTIHYAAGRYAEAARAYEKALELDPKAPAKHRNLGDVYRKLGRTQDARRAYASACEITEQMLRVNPNDARTLGMLAVYEAKLGRFDAARGHVTQAEALAPGDGDVRYRKAVVLALAGEPDAALAELREALRNGYSASVARQDEDFDTLRSLPEFAELVAEKPEEKAVNQGGRE